MHKKLRVFIPVIVILLLVLSGIFLYFSRKIEKTSPEALAKSFLTEFFTWNKDNRLDIFSADSTDTYYTPFRQYLTEDALQNLAVNRLPYKYDITVPDGTAAGICLLLPCPVRYKCPAIPDTSHMRFRPRIPFLRNRP